MNPAISNSAMSANTPEANATTASRPAARTGPSVERSIVDPTRQLDRLDALLATEGDPIDLNSLIGRCLGDTTFCGIILHKFAARSADQLASLVRALASNNRTELTDRAHALKGMALNLSAVNLAERAGALEDAARAGEQDLDALVAATRHELDRCVRAVPQKLQVLQQEARSSGIQSA